MTQKAGAELGHSEREAVALRYDRERGGAPEVVAKGRGFVAEAIVARAREAGVYVHNSPQLVQLLMHVDLDEKIPPALYLAVAELLAWLWRIEREASPGSAQPPDFPLA
ncbi:EscU/YscU/HrcU family type III secretion system export apparatus switch protein [Thiomonas sp. FB-Cd]|uniref:EscU/YscU/HrcU family type III secretion system export apparatus switch protein n=1 Tax=Thiomonas sp. FB-Cd TaxID=1158292 RepID=UPI0004DF0C9D|nr:EscU/YscU/HrcU family type III secretion system export apparatus switch protein [Thiomonas sp. FB-Cd]